MQQALCNLPLAHAVDESVGRYKGGRCSLFTNYFGNAVIINFVLHILVLCIFCPRASIPMGQGDMSPQYL